MQDPVCGMKVDPARPRAPSSTAARPTTSAARAASSGSARRRRRSWPPAPPAAAAAGRRADTREYTCPMHPEVVQTGPAPARSAAWRSSR